MGSTFGHLFKITTFGESHGGSVGVVLEGCPPLIEIDLDQIQYELDRRRPGQSKITTPRNEPDKLEILSGLRGNISLGTPISIAVKNKDTRPTDYSNLTNVFRPSHADATYQAKYGIQAQSGGGRASARETIGRVAAGAIAKQILKQETKTEVLAWVKRIHDIEAEVDQSNVSLQAIESNIVRCPNKDIAELMIKRIEEISQEGDSCGGMIECVVKNPPIGLGMPVFDKLEADLAKALISLPATKSFEVGSGIQGTFTKGSDHNDEFLPSENGRLKTATNNSGGIQGGISNGEPIILRVGFKPTATIRKKQITVDSDGNPTTLGAKGRHDPCVLPRAVPMVEAMVALVLVDHLLRQRGQCGK